MLIWCCSTSRGKRQLKDKVETMLKYSLGHLLQSISVKSTDQFSHLVNGYWFFRCLEKLFWEERNKNKKGISRGVTTSYKDKENSYLSLQNAIRCMFVDS